MICTRRVYTDDSIVISSTLSNPNTGGGSTPYVVTGEILRNQYNDDIGAALTDLVVTLYEDSEGGTLYVHQDTLMKSALCLPPAAKLEEAERPDTYPLTFRVRIDFLGNLVTIDPATSPSFIRLAGAGQHVVRNARVILSPTQTEPFIYIMANQDLPVNTRGGINTHHYNEFANLKAIGAGQEFDGILIDIDYNGRVNGNLFRSIFIQGASTVIRFRQGPERLVDPDDPLNDETKETFANHNSFMNIYGREFKYLVRMDAYVCEEESVGECAPLSYGSYALDADCLPVESPEIRQNGFHCVYGEASEVTCGGFEPITGRRNIFQHAWLRPPTPGSGISTSYSADWVLDSRADFTYITAHGIQNLVNGGANTTIVSPALPTSGLRNRRPH